MDYGASQVAAAYPANAVVKAATGQWSDTGSAEQLTKRSSSDLPESASPEANGAYSGEDQDQEQDQAQDQQQQQQQQQWPWPDDEPQAERDSDYDEDPVRAPQQPTSSGSGYDTDLSLPSHGR